MMYFLLHNTLFLKSNLSSIVPAKVYKEYYKLRIGKLAF